MHSQLCAAVGSLNCTLATTDPSTWIKHYSKTEGGDWKEGSQNNAKYEAICVDTGTSMLYGNYTTLNGATAGNEVDFTQDKWTNTTKPWWVTHECATNFCEIELKKTDDDGNEIGDRPYCMRTNAQMLQDMRNGHDMAQTMMASSGECASNGLECKKTCAFLDEDTCDNMKICVTHPYPCDEC